MNYTSIFEAIRRLRERIKSELSTILYPECVAEPIGVNPRGCGEAKGLGPESAHRTGRSPRKRGSLQTTFEAVKLVRSIPAYAGKLLRTSIILHSGFTSPQAAPQLKPRRGFFMGNWAIQTAVERADGPSR